jgi:hypothetical protein
LFIYYTTCFVFIKPSSGVDKWTFNSTRLYASVIIRIIMNNVDKNWHLTYDRPMWTHVGLSSQLLHNMTRTWHKGARTIRTRPLYSGSIPIFMIFDWILLFKSSCHRNCCIHEGQYIIYSRVSQQWKMIYRHNDNNNIWV